MRVSLAWLAELVDLPPEADLVERLSLGGLEDVAVLATGPDLSAVQVGRVVAREKHPNADRLSVCEVALGEGASASIVCGAPNVAAGQKVAVALPGVSLPDGTRIRRSKIRGVVSEGMICSPRELGLGDGHDGIWVLPEDAVPGVPLPDAVATGDRVLEVGITPNRGDAASLLGLAREVRALFGGALRLPDGACDERGDPAAGAVRVAIEEPAACFHYVARVVRGVRVGPSPEWVARRLETSGIRPINTVVDATNLVLLERGQPLHAFDLSALRGAEVRVRRARAGEALLTLDGQRRILDPADLVIADAERAVALAGVMGGADTEVGEATRDVLIESAHFEPATVRRSARRHGLHSEASYRFERGVDREGIARAADRVARLLAELAGGEVAPGRVEARGSAAPATEEVELEVARANRLLGTELSGERVRELLERVDIACREPAPGRIAGRIPSHRNDLHRPEDLIEEVARIHGYDRIPTTEPRARLVPAARPPLLDLAERTRDGLAACGLVECMSFPFVRASDLEALRLAADDPRRSTLTVANPMSEEESALRSSLLPSLLALARQNLNRQVERVRIFEVSRVFLSRGEGELPDEPLWAAALLTEAPERQLWGPAPPLFFEAKGIAESLLNQLGYVATFRPGAAPGHLHPGAAVGIRVRGSGVGADLGAVGEIHPEVADHFGIAPACAVLELDLRALADAPRRDARAREVSRQPSVRRDLAVLVDRGQPAGELLEAVRKSAGPDAVSVELFDRYEGPGVPEDRVSLAFRIVFQRADRTLQDAEVARATDRVVRTLSKRFGAELRQG